MPMFQLQCPNGHQEDQFCHHPDDKGCRTALCPICNETIPTGADAAYVLNGTASPEPDTSGNGYDATLTGTGEGSAPDACPNLRGLMLMGVGR